VSNHLISAAYKRDLKSPMRKSVMALLADKASDDGTGIYASKQTMADELCCSRKAIIDTIKAFLGEGLLVEIGTRRAPNGFTVEYGIDVDALEALPLVKCHADKAKRKAGGDPSPSVTRHRDIRVTVSDPSPSITSPVYQGDPNPPEPSPSPIASQSTKEDAEEPRLLPDHVLEAWNDMAATCGLPKARMNDARRKRLRSMIRQHTITDFTEAIGCVERNSWMHGENDRGWRADFDFLLQPKSFAKLMEGSYDRA
jgi:biotin operon repressor